jgi:hypothetical protein
MKKFDYLIYLFITLLLIYYYHIVIIYYYHIVINLLCIFIYTKINSSHMNVIEIIDGKKDQMQFEIGDR